MIKVSGIIHRRLKESDTRIAWLMLDFFLINGDINNKEEIHYVMLITSMSQNKQGKKQNGKV